MREPTVVRWPGRVPAGATCDEFASTIDIVPTFAKLIGAALPEHKIDGHDIAPLLFGEDGATSPHECFLHYYAGGQLQAVRDPRWKLHFPHKFRTMAGKPGGTKGSPNPYSQGSIALELFDLDNDPGETKDVAAEHPEVVARLQALADAARADLGDKLTKTKGAGIRPAAKLEKGDARLTW